MAATDFDVTHDAALNKVKVSSRSFDKHQSMYHKVKHVNKQLTGVF